MRIVLLCGGSGKRLWPLSNDIRSKVFLRLLTTEDGVKESMIERICRQLDEAGLLQSTCIVTHHSQAEITRRYVGNNIPIISE
uniref:sugar phosphate nucleotidyltransferase n=2 Tax=Bacillales TaxID=1385 RepID=UPI0021B56979